MVAIWTFTKSLLLIFVIKILLSGCNICGNALTFEESCDPTITAAPASDNATLWNGLTTDNGTYLIHV